MNPQRPPLPPEMADLTAPDEIRADIARAASILAARDAFDLSVDVKHDVPGIHGRLASLLLELASRVLYRYAIRNAKSGGVR